jgi:exopolyphosphatase/guanosine-5'-triphosphate,3'-diphosphate pyrophosphatase
MREATVAQFVRRYHADAAQAERVRLLALKIFDGIVGDKEDNEADRVMLDWSARVAEIGLSVAHAQYHKHSAYILSNADMPGFSRMEQQRLARIVLAHRGKLDKMQDVELEDRDWTLVFALRIAALVLRNRTDARFPMLRVEGAKSGYSIDLPQAWLEENPLAAAALDTEAGHWEAVDLRFTVNNLSEKKVAQLRN